MELPAVNLKISKLQLRPGDSPRSLAADNLGLHCILGLLCLGQLHYPGLGCVGCGSAGLHRRHKHVSGWLAGHHLPGHCAHQHLLPADQPHGHGPLWRGHGHPQLAAQAALLLLRLPHVPGARGFPWTFSGP
ncbi:type-1 angiotensin II receptor-associated protein isoform X9 [Trachypithecus francoisi]|uniref:type-1 angiotensin II receptor-associated protein isoform X9 n=1 Tax=Trachypithecus francoisi TaxID=54180 RepID=UPI00141B0B86|nr:type-1 angiotensin II receptor-associated protein isoform X9 [Trachypithecus francoisi]